VKTHLKIVFRWNLPNFPTILHLRTIQVPPMPLVVSLCRQKFDRFFDQNVDKSWRRNLWGRRWKSFGKRRSDPSEDLGLKLKTFLISLNFFTREWKYVSSWMFFDLEKSKWQLFMLRRKQVWSVFRTIKTIISKSCKCFQLFVNISYNFRFSRCLCYYIILYHRLKGLLWGRKKLITVTKWK